MCKTTFTQLCSWNMSSGSRHDHQIEQFLSNAFDETDIRQTHNSELPANFQKGVCIYMREEKLNMSL